MTPAHLSLRCPGSGAPQALLLAVVMALLLLAPAPVASAVETDTFRLEPHPLRVQGQERRSFDLDLEPGQTVGEAVRITNRTDRQRRFRLYAADADTDRASGAVLVATQAATPHGVGSWVDVDRDELVLDPRASEVVRFTVSRPEGSTGRGMGAVVAEEIGQAPEGGGIEVLFRLAIVVRLQGEIAGLEVSEPQLEIPVTLVPSRGSVETTLTNATLLPVRATVLHRVHSLTGRQWQLEAVDVLLEPGESRAVGQRWSTVPRWGGTLRPSVSVRWEAGDIERSGDRRLHPPTWLLAIAIVLVGIRGARETWAARRRGAPRSTAAPRASSDLLARRAHPQEPPVREPVGS